MKYWKDELYKYISGIVSNENQKLIIINGGQDHIHILLSLSPNVKISDIMRVIKTNSSKFINENKFVQGKFHWQDGYAAFSCSYSQLNKIIEYIKNQEEHHKIKTFKEEYIGFLKKNNIPYDEKYVFDVNELD